MFRELILKAVAAALVILLLGHSIEGAAHGLGIYLGVSNDQLPVFQDFVLALVIGVVILFPVKRLGL